MTKEQMLEILKECVVVKIDTSMLLQKLILPELEHFVQKTSTNVDDMILSALVKYFNLKSDQVPGVNAPALEVK
jgi:hypothetical protein